MDITNAVDQLGSSIAAAQNEGIGVDGEMPLLMLSVTEDGRSVMAALNASNALFSGIYQPRRRRTRRWATSGRLEKSRRPGDPLAETRLECATRGYGHRGHPRPRPRRQCQNDGDRTRGAQETLGCLEEIMVPYLMAFLIGVAAWPAMAQVDGGGVPVARSLVSVDDGRGDAAFSDAGRFLRRQMAKDPELDKQMNDWGHLTLEQQIRKFQSVPKAAAAAKVHGISVRDQVLSGIALVDAMYVASRVRQRGRRPLRMRKINWIWNLLRRPIT